MGADEHTSASQHAATAAPPFQPLPSSHAVPEVHSVVPDLMRVYESLTKTHNMDQGPSTPQQQTQPPPSHSQAPAPAHHVNYACITSEEQYRQLYQHQSSSNGDPNQMPPLQHSYQDSSNGVATSLPFIPAPYPATAANAQPVFAIAPAQGSSEAETSSGSDTRLTSRRRKRTTASQENVVEQDEPSASSSSKPKGRKKSKETDARWSKRFTWPEELHRDFVSAVFDVGLKHSSPATILEHMPKHPQITSERIKSHLQKYRVHRVKSKQDFMSSYEATLNKFKVGGMENVKTLSDGEVAAHLSQKAMTDVADPSSNGDVPVSQSKAQVKQEPQTPQGGAPSTMGAPPPGHEALMLPKLTEAEKASPIGSSMGYLLGLFFSLKKQLLTQRAMNTKSSVVGVSTQAPFGQQVVSADPHAHTAGPANAPYDSFGGTAVNHTGQINGENPMQAQPQIVATSSMDWSSSTANPAISNGGGDHGLSSQTGGAVANPVAVQTGSTRNNLEASSMMKREMQNQMAFQNKMRALKQQELNKYKDVNNANNANMNNEFPHHHHQQHQQHQPEQQYAESHSQDSNRENGPPTSAHADLEHDQRHAPHHPQDQHDDPVEGGDATGEAGGAARGREGSFSMGNNEDFWNADVMDDQLFEFLMNT